MLTIQRCFNKFNEGDPAQKKVAGFFHQATPKKLNVYLYVHHDPTSKINPEKTLFIAFKGTSTLKELFITDLAKTVVPQKMGNLTTAANTTLGSGFAHAGFVQALGKDTQIIHDRLQELLKVHPDVTNISITGHSLGGALAILYTLALANGIARREVAPEIMEMGGKIRLITFGAPNVFPRTLPGQPPAIGALLFNKYLRENKIFTFDYVSTPGDIVPPIPPAFTIPGERVGLTELRSFSKKGRATWIGNVRAGFGVSQQSGGGLLGNLKSKAMTALGPGKNDLPYYKSMISMYNPADPFAKDVSLLRQAQVKFNGTSSSDRAKIRALVLSDLKNPNEPEPVEAAAAEDAAKKEDEASMAGIPEVKAGTEAQKAKGDKEEEEVQAAVAASSTQPSEIADVSTKDTSIYLPNRITYNCSKAMTNFFCHAGYFYSFIRAFSNPATVVLPRSDYVIYNAPGATNPWSETITNYTFLKGKNSANTLSPKPNLTGVVNVGSLPSAAPAAGGRRKSTHKKRRHVGRKRSYKNRTH